MQMEANHVLRGKASLLLALSILFALAAARFASAEVHYHDFVIKSKKETRLCKTKSIITVNGLFPGPTLEVRNGDTLVIKAINRARYNITLHWHGVRQLRTAWADGPEYVTQCPIQPGGSYTYRFTIEDQEGTLWWHAHSSWLRATVYGALVIRPKLSSSYPFPQPKREIPILLGEWWKANPINVVNQAARTGAAPRVSDAFTINGQPGDMYNCSSQGTTIIQVNAGETNLLRIINAALNQELFFSIAGHSVTVVAADASYTKPFTTNILMIAPGQTTDVLVNTNKAAARYYMAAHAFNTARGAPFDNTTTTAILQYNSAASSLRPAFPTLPAFNDTSTAAAFGASIKSSRPTQVPKDIDDNLFITVGLGNFDCPRGQRCRGPNGKRFTASMNNVSFVLPRNVSILQAAQFGVPGVFTTDFPSFPPRVFDFTARNISRSLYQPLNGTRVYRLKYGSRVQVVFQGTNILFGEEHPMHIHGFRFYVLATGSGNFNPSRDTAKFNLVDPPLRNTIGVPVRGWAAIRFVADNPGVWLVHCHLDVHITWGLAMAFLVENGVGESQSLQPPPADLPKC